MWHDGMPGWGMSYGWLVALIWIVLLLAIAALVKYVFFENRRQIVGLHWRVRNETSQSAGSSLPVQENSAPSRASGASNRGS